MKEGEQLRSFIDNQPKSKISIARDLGISKQTLFQYFKSKELTEETKQRIESYFGKKIFVKSENGQQVSIDQQGLENLTLNGQDKASNQNVENMDTLTQQSLVRTLENMSEDKIRSTAIIERLVALLENSFSSGQRVKAPEAPAVSDTPMAAQRKQEDLALDKKYFEKEKAGKDQRRDK